MERTTDWSLHAPDNALRDELVPINRKYPLEELLPACAEYVAADRRRKVTFEYVMLDGINDSDAHAKALIRLLEGVPAKMNLIRSTTSRAAPTAPRHRSASSSSGSACCGRG